VLLHEPPEGWLSRAWVGATGFTGSQNEIYNINIFKPIFNIDEITLLL
jgi:hypothetical protein